MITLEFKDKEAEQQYIEELKQDIAHTGEQITIREKMCCNKPMLDIGVIDGMDMNINSVERHVCKECFRIIDVIDYALDDEELEQLKGYNDELDKAIDNETQKLNVEDLGIDEDDIKATWNEEQLERKAE